jgi:hypothetical protein
MPADYALPGHLSAGDVMLIKTRLAGHSVITRYEHSSERC